MLSFMNPERVLRNMWVFCSDVEEPSNHEQDLRSRYFTCLNKLQEHKIRFLPASGEFLLDFDLEDPQTRALLIHFLGTPEHLDECYSAKGDRDIIAARISAAMEVLARYDLSVASVVRLLIGCLLIARRKGSFGGASIGDTLGIVWLRPSPTWKPIDYAESILHESVHQTLFLDEIVNGLFTENLLAEMSEERGLVTSAVWPYTSEAKAKRPYDRAFHAACVGVILADFYTGLNLPERAATFSRFLPVTTSELKEKQEFLTARGREILEEVERLIPVSGRVS